MGLYKTATATNPMIATAAKPKYVWSEGTHRPSLANLFITANVTNLWA
jgi:hypothetical protein